MPRYARYAAIAATVGLACSFATPAFATNMTPITGSPGESPQDICNRSYHPDQNAGFTAVVQNLTTYLIGVETRRTGAPPVVTGVGTPVYGGWSNHTGLHVNGHSPNIHAFADAASTTYPGGSNSTYQTEIVSTYGYMFDCHVHKDTIGTHVEPPGHQSSGNKTAAIASLSQVAPGPPEVVFDPTPYVVPGGATGVQVVVCISPGSKGGNWRMQNGYTGSPLPCTRATYDFLNPAGTPSASLPEA